MYLTLQPKQISAVFPPCAFAYIVPSALIVILLLSHHMSGSELRLRVDTVVIIEQLMLNVNYMSGTVPETLHIIRLSTLLN